MMAGQKSLGKLQCRLAGIVAGLDLHRIAGDEVLLCREDNGWERTSGLREKQQQHPLSIDYLRSLVLGETGVGGVGLPSSSGILPRFWLWMFSSFRK